MRAAERRAASIKEMADARGAIRAADDAIETHVIADDLTRYTKPDAIFHCMREGTVRLVRLSWLIETWQAGGVLTRLQDTPNEAFLPHEELEAIYTAIPQKDNPDGVLPLISVSYCAWPRHARANVRWPCSVSSMCACTRARARVRDVAVGRRRHPPPPPPAATARRRPPP